MALPKQPNQRTMKILVNLLIIIGLPLLLVPEPNQGKIAQKVSYCVGDALCLSYPESLLEPIHEELHNDIILVNNDSSVEVVLYQVENIFDWDIHQIQDFNLMAYREDGGAVSIVQSANSAIPDNAIIFRHKSYLHYQKIIMLDTQYLILNISKKNGTLNSLLKLTASINLPKSGV
jgi:hypothetical protein